MVNLIIRNDFILINNLSDMSQETAPREIWSDLIIKLILMSFAK